jgi:hypothetical protein
MILYSGVAALKSFFPFCELLFPFVGDWLLGHWALLSANADDLVIFEPTVAIGLPAWTVCDDVWNVFLVAHSILSQAVLFACVACAFHYNFEHSVLL